MQTILLLKSAFLCVFRFFGLSSFDTVTTLILSLLVSFHPFFEVIPEISIQFASGMEAGRISAGIRENAGKALELDSTNVRGWYVLGSNDYYTPASFGGGKKVEYYLKKATSSPDKNTDDSSLPTWGREYAYALLIQYYMQNDRTDEAKNCLLMAEKEYPDSYFIGEYKRKLDE